MPDFTREMSVCSSSAAVLTAVGPANRAIAALHRLGLSLARNGWRHASLAAGLLRI